LFKTLISSSQSAQKAEPNQHSAFGGEKIPVKKQTNITKQLRRTCKQGRNEGVKGGTIPRVPKSSNNVTSTSFNTAHLTPACKVQSFDKYLQKAQVAQLPGARPIPYARRGQVPERLDLVATERQDLERVVESGEGAEVDPDDLVSIKVAVEQTEHKRITCAVPSAWPVGPIAPSPRISSISCRLVL